MVEENLELCIDDAIDLVPECATTPPARLFGI
jgi:hypothetical protein